MAIPTREDFENAAQDLESIQQIATGGPAEIVETRLGGRPSASKIINDSVADASNVVQTMAAAGINGIAATVSAAEQSAAQTIAALGWVSVGTFIDGFTIENRNQYAEDDSGNFYKWSGVLPKNVPASSTPAGSGGVSSDAWVLINIDDANNVSDVNGTTVQTALDRAGQTLFAPLLTQIQRGGVARILYVGTSIEASSASGWRVWMKALKEQYGDSGNYTQRLAGLGGNYEAAYQGWLKQPYCGFFKHRIRGDSSSSAMVLSQGAVRRIVIRYSRELDGGLFDLWVDGVYNRTINCQGDQLYSNEIVLEWPELGVHTIEFKPPSSGFAYIETVDWCQDHPGIHVMDGAYGGSMLQNYVVDRIPSGAQVPPVPVDGYQGLSSVFNNQSPHTKPDLIIFPYTVNDSGRGVHEVNAYTIPALQMVLGYVRDAGNHLITCCEMGGHYSNPASHLHEPFSIMRNAMMSTQQHPFVTFIDWHALAGLAGAEGGRLLQLSERYYSVENLDVDAHTFSGDYIHPNRLGHAVLTDALNVLTGSVSPSLPYPFGLTETPGKFEANSEYPVPASDISHKLGQSIGVAMQKPNSIGIERTCSIVGSSRNVATLIDEPARISVDELNYASAFNQLIDNSEHSDEYGRYIDATSISNYLNMPLEVANPDVPITLTFIASGDGSIAINDASNSESIPIYGQDVATAVSLLSGYPYQCKSKAPRIYHLTLQCTDARAFVRFSGRLYRMFLTPTQFACIALRSNDESRFVSAPKPGAILPLEKVVRGQSYIDDGIEKIALKEPVINVVSGAVESLYRLYETATDKREVMTLHGTLTDSAHDEKFGAPTTSTTASPKNYRGDRRFSASDALRRMTIVLSSIDKTPTYKVYLFTGSANRYLGLNSDGTWSVESFATTPKTFTNIDSKGGLPIYVSLMLPDASLFESYTNWELRVQWGEGGSEQNARYITLCEGRLPTV